MLPPRYFLGVDPELVGLKAFSHPAVKGWWHWLLNEYRPRYNVALLTPCSNVKPYTRSPTSRKIRGMLRRLGLWDSRANMPRGIEWLYLSDLLVLVPYEKAEEYPACCYDLPPEVVIRNSEARQVIMQTLCSVMERLSHLTLVTFLPRKHKTLLNESRNMCRNWPKQVDVNYTVFSLKELENTIKQVLGTVQQR